jgi:hypothetical protein
MDVAYKLRLEENIMRPRVAEIARSGVKRPIANEPPEDSSPQRSRPPVVAMPRPGLEALRLRLHFASEVKDRLIAAYFVNDVQREIFEGLSLEQPLSDVIDHLQRRGEEDAAQVLSQLAVDELDREYTAEDVSAVISQLIRSAVNAELKNIERELREDVIAPDVAMATIRDVKERVELLGTPQGDVAEKDLRSWLLERSPVSHS